MVPKIHCNYFLLSTCFPWFLIQIYSKFQMYFNFYQFVRARVINWWKKLDLVWMCLRKTINNCHIRSLYRMSAFDSKLIWIIYFGYSYHSKQFSKERYEQIIVNSDTIMNYVTYCKCFENYLLWWINISSIGLYRCCSSFWLFTIECLKCEDLLIFLNFLFVKFELSSLRRVKNVVCTSTQPFKTEPVEK